VAAPVDERVRGDAGTGTLPTVSVRARVEEAGGFVLRADLLEHVPRAEVDAALRSGEIVADGRGRYATPATDEAVRSALRLGGVLCLTSAALHHGWAVKAVPAQPHVSVPRNRKLSAERRQGVRVHWRTWAAEDVNGMVTGVEATLLQCLTQLPFDEALAVADSALREGVPPSTLRRVAMTARGPGAPQARRVAREARPDAANPFESVLRAISLDVPGLRLVPQLLVALPDRDVYPDLVDVDLAILAEADSFAWHGDRAALVRDAHRYNQMAVAGWLVLRFSWEQVMLQPEVVRAVLVAAVGLVQRRAGSAPGGRRTA